MRSVFRSLSAVALVAAASAFPLAVAGAQQAVSVCKDGSTSSAVGRGACSGHGGVDPQATTKAKSATRNQAKADRKEAKVAAKAGASVTCGDGSMSAAGRGACSHHGGIKTGAAASVNPPVATPAPMAAARTSTRTTTARTPTASRTTPATAERTSASAAVGSGSREDNNPAGAVAKCRDGLYSHAHSHQGACGHHGGVAQWIGE